MKRVLLAGLAILFAWMLIDLLLHRLFLAPIYEASTSLWRPFDQMKRLLVGESAALATVDLSARFAVCTEVASPVTRQ